MIEKMRLHRVIIGILLIIALVALAIFVVNTRESEDSEPPVTSETESPAATVPAIPSSPNEVMANVALVSIEGEVEGEIFGCGDTTAIIQREISSLEEGDIVEQAIAELFAIDTQVSDFDGLELYNALHNSNLSVESINEEDSTINVYLTGELMLGGTCDSPRVQEQLEMTVLENSEAETVNIFINDEPLGEVLSTQ